MSKKLFEKWSPLHNQIKQMSWATPLHAAPPQQDDPAAVCEALDEWARSRKPYKLPRPATTRYNRVKLARIAELGLSTEAEAFALAQFYVGEELFAEAIEILAGLVEAGSGGCGAVDGDEVEVTDQ